MQTVKGNSVVIVCADNKIAKKLEECLPSVLGLDPAELSVTHCVTQGLAVQNGVVSLNTIGVNIPGINQENMDYLSLRWELLDSIEDLIGDRPYDFKLFL